MATIGGALIAGAGYATLGFVLAAGMAVPALLVLRVDDPLSVAPPVRGRPA